MARGCRLQALPKVQSPKPKAQSPKPKAQSPKPKAQSLEPRAWKSHSVVVGPSRESTSDRHAPLFGSILRWRSEDGVIGRGGGDRSSTRDGERRLSLRLSSRARHADPSARGL